MDLPGTSTLLATVIVRERPSGIAKGRVTHV